MKNLKPFDLEKALAGAKVVSRDGIEVTEIKLFESIKHDFKVVAISGGDVATYTIDGVYSCTKGESKYDLFLAPELKTGWVNIYPNGESYWHETKEGAERECKNYLIACTKIEWYE